MSTISDFPDPRTGNRTDHAFKIRHELTMPKVLAECFKNAIQIASWNLLTNEKKKM